MEHKELAEMIESGKVSLGDAVWICDYRYDDPLNKPIRHVPPQKAILTDASNTSKTIYYSDFYFAPIGKTGKPLATIIAPFDNTGYRGYTGKSLQIFLNEVDCKQAYSKQCDEIIQQLKDAESAMAKVISERVAAARKHKQENS